MKLVRASIAKFKHVFEGKEAFSRQIYFPGAFLHGVECLEQAQEFARTQEGRRSGML
jgi:hypothetical protein